MKKFKSGIIAVLVVLGIASYLLMQSLPKTNALGDQEQLNTNLVRNAGNGESDKGDEAAKKIYDQEELNPNLVRNAH